jgi:MoxR-like ATPase
VIEGDVGRALAALDQRLLRVCALEERRAERMKGGERGWEALRAALRPPAEELAYDRDDDAPPMWPAHGPAALVRAKRALGLDALDADLLLVLLAPHVEPRYLRVLIALQDDAGGGHLVERCLTTVLGRTPARARAVAVALSESGRLLRAGLIATTPGEFPPQGRPIDLAADVRDALLELPPPTSLAGATLAWSAPGAPAPTGHVSVIHGAGERRARAEEVLEGATTVSVDGAALDGAALRAVWRAAALRGAVPIVDLSTVDLAAATTAAEQLVGWVRGLGGSAVVLAREPLPVPAPHHAVPGLGYQERVAAWRTEAAAAARPLTDGAVEQLAVNLRLNRDEIRRVLGASAPAADAEALCATARRLTGGGLRHGALVETRRSFDDMVLRDTTRTALERLIHFTRHRDRLAETWSLEARFRLRRGPIVLFSGRSGTGKTLAAEVIAGALGRPLHVVDLSRLVSKYIGETEKHIDEVLRGGERAGAVLFFDEADALFASRTEVSSSNDRYANLEVGYLLQRIESHDGLVILATNLMQTIDEAFLRRFHTRIEFPFPEASERRALWELMVPPEVPRDGAFDLDALAATHRLAGGDIRNAALKGIFLAAQDGTPLDQRHLEHAIAIELHELGRLSRHHRATADAGHALREVVGAIETAIDRELRARFRKEIHVIHGSPTRETLAGRRPAISLAVLSLARGAEVGGLKLGLVVSAWSARAEEELELLGVLLEVFATLGLPPIAGRRCTVRVQPSHDFDLLHRFWSSHGHPVRASLVLELDVSP